MTPERHRRAMEILGEALELDPGARDAYLETACGGDDELRREVGELLGLEEAREADGDDLLAEPLVRLAAGAEAEDPRIGTRIGPYKILRRIGHGGMGTVYLAEREDPYRQEVALKVIQRRVSNPAMLQRFSNERQILANLAHPNIATLLDGGTTDDGLPYFVLEHVAGEPIDRYCARRRLGSRRRLELFLDVCSALARAHQNLVVHRDLKPGNILVTDEGVPKLLDFGIAKPLAPEDAMESVATLPQAEPMTVRYASPEQIEGGIVTTASDVYSLGVLLYELLTGVTPYPEGRTRYELLRSICERDPPRPSTAVRRRALHRGAAPEPEAGAGDELRELSRKLAGDLDGIVLKAMSKDPDHRYTSVEQLAEDVRRHLDGFPVSARDGTFPYLAGKFVRRHRWWLLAAAVFLLVVVGSAITATILWQRAERERDVARREKERAVRVVELFEGLFEASNPDQARGQEPTASEILARGERELKEELEEDPEVRASLLGTLGTVYRSLGHSEKACGHFEEVLAIRRRHYSEDHPEEAKALVNLAICRFDQGRYDAAARLSRESLEMKERLGVPASDLLTAKNNLASILKRLGEYREAETLYREVLEARRRQGVEDEDAAVELAKSLRNLATLYYALGELERAEPLLHESLAVRQNQAYLGDPGSVHVALALNDLGRLHHARGELGEAEALYRRALELRRRRFPEGHSHVVSSQRDLAALLVDRGAPEGARQYLDPALAAADRAGPEDDLGRALTWSVYGAYLTAVGCYGAAEWYLVESLRIVEGIRGPDTLDTRCARERLEELYLRRADAGSDSPDGCPSDAGPTPDTTVRNPM